MAGPIRIAVLADAGQARRELSSVANETSSLGSKIGSFGKAAGVAAVAGLAVAGAAAVKFGVDAVQAASSAQQSLGATETVFGKFSQTVIKTSDEAATKYGLSANVYRENANLLGSLFKNQGVAVGDLAGKTEGMIGTASDLAATFGGTTTDAVEALGAAFKGEFDSLEKYGISIKQSDVNARLAAQGQDDLTGAALKQAEQLAKTALISEQAAQTTGAFAKETDTLAHQQQVLGAQFENVKAKIGTALLPIITTVVSFISTTALPAFVAFGDVLRDKLGVVFETIRGAVAGLLENLAPVGAFFAANTEIIKGAAIALGIAALAAVALGAAMGIVAIATAPITLIIVGIAALGAGLAYAYKNSETFRNGIQAIVGAFKSFIATVVPIVKQIVAAVAGKFRELQPQIKAVWASIQDIIKSALSIIKGVISTVTGAIKSIWENFGATILRFITTTMTNVANLIKSVFQIIQGIFKVVSSALKGDWSGLWDGIKQIVSGALGVVKALISQGFNTIRTITSTVWTALRAIVAKAWDGIKSAVSAGISGAITLVKSLPGKILGALGNLGSLLYNAGRDIIQGLLDGIGSMISSVTSKLKDLTNLIPDIKGPPAKDKVLLRPAGRMIIQGLIDGFTDGQAGVVKALERITKIIEKQGEARFKNEKKAAEYVKDKLRGLSDEYTALKRNGAEQDRNAAKLETATSAYKGLIDQARQYAASVKDAVVSYGSVVGLGENEDGTVSASTLLQQLRDKLAASEAFAAAIAKLRGAGLNETALRQLADAGVEGGLATAQALADGGRAVIAEANSLTAQITQVGAGLGQKLSEQFNQAGIDAAAGVVAGLRKQGVRLDAVADRLANRLVQSVMRQLGPNQGTGKTATASRTTALAVTSQRAPGADEETRRSAQVAAQTTQAVYGAQQAELRALVTASTAAIKTSEASITRLDEQVAGLGRRVHDGATDGSQAGARLLKPDLIDIRNAIRSLPRETGEQKKKGKV